MVSRYLLYALLVVISIGNRGLSQNFTYDKFTRFVNYNDQNGLSNNHVNDIVQDSKGFIWFATENGLNRFDGNTFVSFFHSLDNNNSLPGDIVTSLATDGNEYLWVGTTEGLCRININNGEINRVLAIAGNPNSPRTNHIRKIFYSKSSKILWIETLEGILSSYHTTTNEWKHFIHQAVQQPFYRYHTIFEDSDGNLWLGGRNTPIMKFDTKSANIHVIEARGLSNKGKRDNDLADIFETSEGKWFVVGLDGIYQFSPNGEEFKKIHTTSTYSIIEDESGSVWFGSGNGLIRFDSEKNNFHTFQKNLNNPFSIVHNHINKVFIDMVGNIWVGTRNGVSMLSKKSEVFQYYFHIPDDKSSLIGNEVTAIAQGNDGTIYVGTANEGLSLLKKGSDSFKHFTGDISKRCSLSSNRISALYADKQGDLWVGLWAGVGFNKFNSENGCFTRYAMDYETRKRDWYNAFLEDSKGNFLVGLWGSNGASYFDRKKGEFILKDFISFEKPFNRRVEDIVGNGMGDFFFITNEWSLLYMYKSESKKYSSHRYIDKNNINNSIVHGFEDDLPFLYEAVKCVVSDSNGLTFFATEEGVFGHHYLKGFFTLFKNSINPISMIVENDVLYLLEPGSLTEYSFTGVLKRRLKLDWNDSRRLITSEHNYIIIQRSNSFAVGIKRSQGQYAWKFEEVFQYNPITDLLIEGDDLWITSQKGLYSLSVSELVNNDKQKLNVVLHFDAPFTKIVSVGSTQLVAFSPLGAYTIDVITKNITLLSLDQQKGGISNAVNAVSVVNTDTLWVGNDNGHFQISLSSGCIIETNLPDSNRITSHLVSTLMEDSKGNIWIGTTNAGLNRVDAETGKIHHFYSTSNVASLPSMRVNATFQTSDGKVWVATDKGLSYIVSDFVFRIDDPQLQLDFQSIIEDQNRLLWAGSNKGLVSINVATSEVKLYDESHGLPSSSFTKAALSFPDGRLSFGTQRGFVIFNPDQFSYETDYSSDVSISQFSVFNEPIGYHFNSVDTLNLHYSQNFFSINLTANDFGYRSGTTFLYRLSGIDRNWVTSKSNIISYTNLSSGKYTFEAKQILSNGLPSDKSSVLHIYIKPPFWKALWFRLLIVVFIVTAVLVYLITYIRQLKADRLNVELEQKLLTSQMNPHFIFNSLSAIQSFMYSNDPEEAGNYLSSFSRLVRLILENSRSSTISIKQEVQTLELYLDLQKLRFPQKFNYVIEVDQKLEQLNLKIPPMLAQPFIENSIEHGIMHKQGMGNIKVSFKMVNGFIRISVEDDGVGIEKSMEYAQNKRLSHNSLATSITRERIKNISKGNSKTVGVSIIDLKKFGKEGTLVEITLPTENVGT